MQPVRSSRVAAVLAVVAVFAACDSTGPSDPELTGTWQATSAVATNPANAASIDLIQDQGITLVLTIAEDDSVELRVGLGGFVDIETGMIELSGDQVTLTLEGDPSTGTWSLDGDTLTLDLRTGVEWDVDEDGLDEPVTMVIVLRRQ